MNFDRFTCRPYKNHPSYSIVDMFYKVKDGNKFIFTQQFKRDYSIVPKNIIITTNNDLISKEICKEYNCIKDPQWITVPKHLSEVMRMDMVLLMNTYCNIINKEQYWDLYYYSPRGYSYVDFRTDIQYTENNDDDEDYSLRP